MLEEKELKLIEELSEEPMVIDCGAGLGEWSLAVRQRRPKAKIYCVEPHPYHADILRSIYPPLVIGECAAGVVEQRSLLFTDGDADGRDFGSSLNRRDHHAGKAYSVTVRRLDHLMSSADNHSPTIDLLKLDVEGEELRAIQGLGELRPKIIQFEYSADTWNAAGCVLDDALLLLSSWGYSFDEIPNRESRYFNLIARIR